MISTRDQADLEWFFGAGLARFERSTCGPMLDRAETFYVKHVADPEIAAARHKRIKEGRYHEAPPGDITARPTAEVREAGREEPNHDDLVRYGRVSRRVARLSTADHTALRGFFGDSGSKWAQAPGLAGRIGRLGALLHLTEAGQRLAKRDERKASGAKVEVTAEVRLETAVVLQDLQPQPARESLLSLAMRQAQGLLDGACVCWNDTAKDSDKQ